MFKLGLIGTGNMGQALLKGILAKGVVRREHIYLYDKIVERVEELKSAYGVNGCASETDLINASDIVLLAVKPNVCEKVLQECANALAGKALISIVTGWSRANLAAIAQDCRILRVMPNTPCLVGEGVIAIDMDHTLREDEFQFADQLFQAVGQSEKINANLMEGVIGVAGSGPAYAYMFIEALADGGVREGLPRDMAYRIAAQMVVGAGKMVLETGQHPGALKDAVCSPGGTTIEAVAALERGGFRAAVLDAVEVCAEKARLMKRN